MKKVTKPAVLKKGKDIFGSTEKFNKWLNTDIIAIGCKPVQLWYSQDGLEKIYAELIRIEHGILI